jgi:hypothetical protein
MEVNETHAPAGLTGVVRAVGVIAVVILALLGIAVVFGLIPQEALQEWLTKAGLTLVIVIAAAVLLGVLMKKS